MTQALQDAVRVIRTGVGLVRHDGIRVHIFDDSSDIERVETRLPMDLAIRDGQFKQGLLLDEQGRPQADLLVGLIQDKLFIVSRGLDAESVAHALGGGIAGDWDIFGIEGPFAWELMASWDSPGIIGLPYLGAFSPREGIHILRAGYTGEYGYLMLIRPDLSDAEWGQLGALGQAFDAKEVGLDAIQHCSLENWVFDPLRDGQHQLDALELQLRWRIDMTKEALGVDALRTHKSAGLRRRITAMSAPSSVSVGATVRADGRAIGTILATAPDLEGDTHRVLAVLDMPYAQPGIDSYLVDEVPCRTQSAPWVLNRSLYVNPQRHAYARRHDVVIPEAR